MIVRYPWEIIIDGLRWQEILAPTRGDRFAVAIGGRVVKEYEPDPWHRLATTHCITWREFDRDTNYVAPRWIAWLYRWLPHSIGWHGNRFDAVTDAPFFLWSLHALKWNLGWLPKRRAHRYPYQHVRLGVLRYGERYLAL